MIFFQFGGIQKLHYTSRYSLAVRTFNSTVQVFAFIFGKFFHEKGSIVSFCQKEILVILAKTTKSIVLTVLFFSDNPGHFSFRLIEITANSAYNSVKVDLQK